MFLLAAGYLLHSNGLLAVAALMGVIWVVAALWTRSSLRSFTYQRRLRYHRSFGGETVPLEVRLENSKLLPLAWLRTSDRWPLAVAPGDETVLAPSPVPGEGGLNLVLVMRGFERIRRPYELLFRKRGIYELGPCTAESGDPFGLFRTEAVAQPAERVVVFPEVRPLHELGLPPDDPFGERRSRRRLFEDSSQSMGVRDYQPGDSFRRIHWAGTARTGRLQSRVYQAVSGLDLIVCLNAATFERHWEGTQPRLFEALLRTTASVVNEAFALGYRVGLISNGCIAHSDRPFRIPPGRSRGQLPRLLEALAGLTPLVTVPFERFLLAQAPQLEYGSSLLVVTSLTSPALAETLVRLRCRCRRTTLISMAEEPPPVIPGVATFHQPLAAEEQVS